MIRFAIRVSSVLILTILVSGSVNAQQVPTTDTSSAGGGPSDNPNTGVDFAINTDNVQNAATGFVGGNASQAFVGGAREATNQQANNRQFGAFQDTQNSSNTQSSQSGTPRSIRTAMRIAFAAPSGTFAQQTGVLAYSNSVQLTQFSTNRPELSGVKVELMADGVAVLTGTSPSTDTSRLAANLVRLQPGVRKVNNQIAVVR